MNKVWSTWLRVAPWLLSLLPLQIVAIELPTTSYIGLGLGLIVLMLILYRTSLRYGLYVRCVAVLFYSIMLGYIAEQNMYELYATQHAMWAVMLIDIVAVTHVTYSDNHAPPFFEKNSLDWYVTGAMLGVFAVAFGLRMTNINYLPVFGGDEASATLFGIAVRDGVVNNLFASGWYEFPAMWFIIPALVHTILPDGMLAVRIHSIIIGSLTCVALVWVLRPLLPLWLATSAGVMLAFIGVHIFFSQIGLNNIYDGFLLVVMFGLLVRQSMSITTAHWGYLGLVIGFALYGYTSARLLPVIFGVWVLMMLWHQKAQWREYSRGFVFVAMFAGVVVAPLLVHYFYRPENMVAPMVRTSFFSTDAEGLSLFARIERDTGRDMWLQLWDHAVASVDALTLHEVTGWYQFSDGLSGLTITTLFVIGIVYTLLPHSALIMRLAVSAVILYLVMSSLSHPIGAGQRLVTAMPLVVMLSAYGLTAIDQILRRYNRAWVSVCVVVLTLGFSSFTHYYAYFNQFLLYEGGAGDGNSRTADFYNQHARMLPAETVVDVYRTGDFNREVNASIDYHSRHLKYSEVTPDQPARINAKVIVIPIGYDGTVDIPSNFIRSIFVVKPSDEILITIAYHPDLQPYLADLAIDRKYPPRFGE
jgi:hypothetical protein